MNVCFSSKKENHVVVYTPNPSFEKYQASVGAHTDNIVSSADKIDKIVNIFAAIALIAYFGIKMRGGIPIMPLKLAAEGLTITATVLSLVRFYGGVEKLATGKIALKDKEGNGKTWEKRAPAQVAADVFLVVARVLLCVFVLQQLGAIQIGTHANWLQPTMLSLFGATTILYLGQSFHDCYKKKGDAKDVAGNLLETAAFLGEVGVATAGSPFGIALMGIGLVANLFNFTKDCAEKVPAASLVPAAA